MVELSGRVESIVQTKQNTVKQMKHALIAAIEKAGLSALADVEKQSEKLQSDANKASLDGIFNKAGASNSAGTACWCTLELAFNPQTILTALCDCSALAPCQTLRRRTRAAAPVSARSCNRNGSPCAPCVALALLRCCYPPQP
jgi:hypothetical protein